MPSWQRGAGSTTGRCGRAPRLVVVISVWRSWPRASAPRLVFALEDAERDLECSPGVLGVCRARCRRAQALGEAGGVVERPAQAEEVEQVWIHRASRLPRIVLERGAVDAAEPPQVAFGRCQCDGVPVDQAQAVGGGDDVGRVRLAVRDDQLQRNPLYPFVE